MSGKSSAYPALSVRTGYDMKNFIAAICLVAVCQCGHAPRESAPADLKYDPAGKGNGIWLDDDTYRVTGIGAPGKKALTREDRRNSSRKSAVMHARYVIIQDISSIRYELISRGISGEIHYTDENPPARVLGDVIRGGSILDEKFDDGDNCVIQYAIHEKGLRKKIIGYLKGYER